MGKVTEKWGSATATLKKGGEVCWNINLEPGRGVKLVLEYEARFSSDSVVVERSRAEASDCTVNGKRAQQDFEMQLMLLEQQNKKRLLKAQQDQNLIR